MFYAKEIMINIKKYINPNISPLAKRILKVLVIVFTFAIIVLVSYGSNLLVNQVVNRERKSLEIYATMYDYLATSSDPLTIINLLDNISQTIYFPMIMTDANDEPIEDFHSFTINIDLSQYQSVEEQRRYLKGVINSMKSQYPPVAIKDDNGQIITKLYYSASSLSQMIQFFPLVAVVGVIIIMLLSYKSLSSARNLEQSKVWIGMARETAHQLGTPTSSLMGWIELLKMNTDDGISQDTLQEMQKDIERLTIISTRFSKIGSRTDVSEIDIAVIITEVCDYYQKRLPNLSGKINIVCDIAAEIKIKANSILMQWVFENLLKNAIESIDGYGTIKIMSNLINRGRKVQILVSDTGKGMTTKTKMLIFEPGFTTKQRGWGIGLSLAKRIVEDYHDGKIYVKDTSVNKGTIFAVELPLDQK